MLDLLPPRKQPAGRITVDTEDGGAVLRLVGEIDEVAIAAFEEQQRRLMRAGAAPGPLVAVVDLSAATFLASGGVSLLLRQTRPAREQGHQLTLRGVSGPARRILEITGVSGLFQRAA